MAKLELGEIIKYKGSTFNKEYKIKSLKSLKSLKENKLPKNHNIYYNNIIIFYSYP